MTQEAPQQRYALPELSLTFVGHSRDGIAPTAWSIYDRQADHDRPPFGMMTLIEKAALRALCEDVLRTLDVASPPTPERHAFPHPQP